MALARIIEHPRFVPSAFVVQVVLTIAILIGLVVTLTSHNRRFSEDVERQVAIAQAISAENQLILREARLTQDIIFCVVLLPLEDRTPEKVQACRTQAEGGGT